MKSSTQPALDWIGIPVYSGGRAIDRLTAASASNPVRIPEGIQFSDSFGIHTAWTEREYKTPLTIEATVMTDSTNICLVYGKGKVILNWDRREDLLHMRHPVTGQVFNVEQAGHVPAGRWHQVEWIIAEDMMRLLVDGEERFLLPGNYRGVSGQVGIHTGWRANLSVGSLEITERYPVAEKEEGTAVLHGYHAEPDSLSSIGCLLGALHYYNRYTDRASLTAGTGIAFQAPAPDGQTPVVRLDLSAVELVRQFGLELVRCDRTAAVSDPNTFVQHAIAEAQPVFGRLSSENGYESVLGVHGDEWMVESGGGKRRVSGSEAAAFAGLELYAVRSIVPMTPREGLIRTFRYAADYWAETGDAVYGEWRVVLLQAAQQENSTDSLKVGAAGWSEARQDAVRYLEQQREHVGESCAGLLEESIRGYRAAAYSIAHLRMEQARDEELGAVRALSTIADKLAGRKLLPGLNFQFPSCISMFITFMGVLKHYNIPCTESWMRGASGRAFLFGIHEQINVHDICLPLPEQRIIQLFANLGLEIDGIEACAEGEAYERLLEQAWDGTRKAIDAGLACFGRSVEQLGGEYALLVGYDQDGYYSSGWHGRHAGAIPWQMYGLGQCQCQPCTIRRNDWRTEGPVKTVCRCDSCQRVHRLGTYTTPQPEGEVRVYWSRPAEPADDRTIVREALQLAVEFAKPGGQWAKPGMRTGTEAYDAIIHALEKGKMDGWYLGLHANGWQELRSHAWQFLIEAKQRLHDADLADELDAAIAAAERLHSHFQRLFEMFPWMQPFGPIPDAERRYAAADLLREAKKAEIDALATYEQLVKRLAAGANIT